MRTKMRMVLLIFVDIVMIHLSYWIAGYLRFEGEGNAQFMNAYVAGAIVITLIKLSVFIAFRLYQSLWRYASIEELVQVMLAVISANGITIIVLYFMQQHFPRSILIIVAVLDVMLIGGVRLVYRVYSRVVHSRLLGDNTYKRIMVVGAGDAGAMVVKELKNNYKYHGKPVALIDDDVTKYGQIINGVSVVGQRYEIFEIVKKKNIDEIIIAIPSASRADLKEIMDECNRTECKVKCLPTLDKLMDRKVKLSDIRDVKIEDLLGREEISLNMDGISHYIANKTVLVTGGGGSIGSELCRQIAQFSPRELVIIDIYENNAYDLQNELKRKLSGLNLNVIIASVRDKRRIDNIFGEIKPDVVFHAAAHKHVPLMEDHPSEAIKNNIFGTLNVAKAADKHCVKQFVQISTDKAVNPTNVMGATKRTCEMIIQGIAKVSATKFVAVRFGNVLGSNGSVIPLFKRQISEGGPITLTHPDIIRYFMTIPEAARLVIQAGGMAKGGEIFILDMGEPVKIMDLAEDLIRKAGLQPHTDIPIKITGLRPGEKLYEELLMDEEGMKSTAHRKIFIGKPIDVDFNKLCSSLDKLGATLEASNPESIKKKLSKIVPTYAIENNVINGEFMKEIAEKKVSSIV